MGAVMNDLLEFIQDLETSQADPSKLKDMILDYKDRVDMLEADMESEQQRDLFYS